MRLLFITPEHLHWRARKKLPILDKLIEDIKQLTNHHIDYILDTETFAVFDYTENRILDSCNVTFNLDLAFFTLENVKRYWYYHNFPDVLLRVPSLNNYYIHLKQLLNYGKEKGNYQGSNSVRNDSRCCNLRN